MWLDAKELKYVEEAGTLLPAVTRDPVIQLARHWSISVSEGPIPIEEVVDGCKSGYLEETFATGTAALISPVGEILFNGSDLKVGNSDEHNFGEQAMPQANVKTGPRTAFPLSLIRL